MFSGGGQGFGESCNCCAVIANSALFFPFLPLFLLRVKWLVGADAVVTAVEQSSAAWQLGFSELD